MMKKYVAKLILFLLIILAHLNFGTLYFISDVLYVIVCYVLRYRDKIIMENLRNSFPDKENYYYKKIKKRFYHHLCDCIVETIKLLHISEDELKKRITVKGGGYIEATASDGHPIITYLGHYGNWEWAQETTKYYILPSISAEIYRKQHSPIATEIMNTIRQRFKTTLIPQDSAVRTLLRWSKAGKQFLVGFISDQRPNSTNLNHWATFLRQDTAVAVGGEEIGNRIHAHFVFLDIEKPQRGHYIMTFKPMELTEKEKGQRYPYTSLCLRMMEQTINRAPEYWLWSHNRWKFKRNK
jgi:KDO2-lipid IV(A) lauroyltransferase